MLFILLAFELEGQKHIFKDNDALWKKGEQVGTKNHVSSSVGDLCWCNHVIWD